MKKIFSFVKIFFTIFILSIVYLVFVKHGNILVLVMDIRSCFRFNNSGKMLFEEALLISLCVVVVDFILAKSKCVMGWKISVGLKSLKIEYAMLHKLLYLVVYGLFVWVIICALPNFGDYKKSTWPKDITVGHSFGEIDGFTYTGSKEAFLRNYDVGHKTFEVDLSLTRDRKIVLSHDWEWWKTITNQDEIYEPSRQEFLEKPIYGKYQAMSFEDLCEVMGSHPDIWIITDTKFKDNEMVAKQFSELLTEAKASGNEEILDRLVIQIYDEDMYEYVENVNHFNNYIFTLYARWYGDKSEFEDICRWSVANGINTITIWDYLYNPIIQEIADAYGISLYVHTVNDVGTAKQFLKDGVNGVYTDSISPSELE